MLPKILQEQLETPCIVIDKRIASENIRKMQTIADDNHCALRPHMKTHKMCVFAKMQLDAGASGITCAKISEAEIMAEGGIRDIFVAYPMVGRFRIKRALVLAAKIQRLILAVDSLEGADELQKAAKEAGQTLEVRLEVDTGAGRTGVRREQAANLAEAIAAMPNLTLTGIYTFKGLVFREKATTDKHKAGMEEGALMKEAAEAIRAKGIALQEISAGSSPTGEEAAKTGCVTEIRPGTYIFNDYMMCREGVAMPEEIAVRYFATVVSTPTDGYAVIDGGTKTFPMDILLDKAPYYYPSYALVEGREDLQLRRMNEEHGIITSVLGNTGLKVGDVLSLIPIHVCTAVNMQNQVYVYDGEALTVERVEARGMLV